MLSGNKRGRLEASSSPSPSSLSSQCFKRKRDTDEGARRSVCAVTGACFTAENGPFFPSQDRLDNALGHTKSNVRWVARLFNGHKTPTRLEWLRDIVLHQTLVKLTLKQRAIVHDAVESMEN